MSNKGVKILESIDFEEDDDDDMHYEEVPDDFFGKDDDDDNDDDLADALASLQLRPNNTNSNNNYDSHHMNDSINSPSKLNQSNVITHVRPSVVDDFIRNFLIKVGMRRSLDVFNAEWYELQSKGKLPTEVATAVPDIYLRNEELDQQVGVLREQMEKMREVASKAQSTWDTFRKERDFHRMHHRRVVQEKNKLINDIKLLRKHLRSYEPMLDELKRKHESAMKEKMLITLERDRLVARVKTMEEQITVYNNNPQASIVSNKNSSNSQQLHNESQAKSRRATRSVRKQGVLPPTDPLDNPFNDLDFDPSNVENYSVNKSMKGHVNSVSDIAFHPKKTIFATASDDETWRLWTATDGELIMSGEGHNGWLAGIDFHPHGSHLATASGDGTVKIWEFAQAKCTHTFSDHAQAVWGCKFHHAGDFVASCSMDHTVRVWDLISGKCRQTLRGHVDSVNALAWQPYTSNICTASGDKTLSVWDGRTGLCVQVLYGHKNACNHLAVTNIGDKIVSCDADGVVKIWDTRMVKEIGHIETGPYASNKLTIDRSGLRAAVASDDGTIKVLNLEDQSVLSTLSGHEGRVQCVTFSPNDSYLVSGSSSSDINIWR